MSGKSVEEINIQEFSTELSKLKFPWVVTSTCIYCPKYQKHGEGYCFYPSISWWIENRDLTLEMLFQAIKCVDERTKLISEDVVEIEYTPNHTIQLKCLR